MTWRRRVREQLEEGSGSWKSCSGCHETEDGYDVGHYPISRTFKCKVGGGCSECGGLGVLWDNTDWDDFAEWSKRRDVEAAQVRIMRRRLAWVRTDFEFFLRNHPGYSDSDGAWDASELFDQVRARLQEDHL